MKDTTKKLTVVFAALLGCLLVAACSGGDDENVVPPPPPLPELSKSFDLKKFKSIDEMNTFIRNSELYVAESMLDRQLAEGCKRPAGEFDTMSFVSGNIATAGTAGEGGAAGYGFTSTNVQEAGVDEADIVKTDGTNMYVVENGFLHNIKIAPIQNMIEVSKTPIDGDATALFLLGDTVIVISETVPQKGMVMQSPFYNGYGWTKVSVFDFKDEAKPVLARESYYEGNYVSSRLINGKMYLVTNGDLNLPKKPQLSMYVEHEKLPECDENNKPKGVSSSAVNESNKLKTDNRTAVDGWKVAMTLPSKFVRNKGGALTPVARNISQFGRADVLLGSRAIGLTLIDIADPNKPDQEEFVVGAADTVYASLSSIYIAGNEYYSTKTVVHRFAIGSDQSNIAYGGSAEVEGWLLNQFSMGEHEGYLRIATSSGFNGNYVTVLKNEGAALKIVGKVDDIAPGEDIKAVRFVGDRGYVVTFKKIDPLFVLDMSDPEDPVVTGELKVPGFSTYLHLLDREHLIGLGKDGDDQGAFAWFQGLKLSLFDVADSSTPKEDSSVTIGSRGTMSPAFDDHLAFTFDRETGLLALPLTLCEGTKGGSKVGSFSYNGVQVYNISANGGISMVGEIKDTTAADAGNGNYYSLCNGWNYTGNIQRTVILKDGAANHIATIALDGVKIYTLGGEIESSVSW